MKVGYIRSGLAFSLASLVASALCLANEPNSSDMTIVEIAAGNKDFSKLVAAVKAAGLVDTLNGEGPFTVFAPTDAAFEALGEETLKAVLADKKKLTAILTYHVIKGKVPASDAIELAKAEKSAKTVNGSEIKLSIKHDELFLNGNTKVISTDIFAKNGVIHVIDKVLLPPAAPVAANANVMRLIEHSIATGAPRYNSGHHRECAMIYHKTATELLQTYHDQMPTNAQRRLEKALGNVNVCGQPRESAWALRHALDDVYGMMPPLMQAAR